MVKIGRVVAPGFPHHITQRGNRRQRIFFDDVYLVRAGLVVKPEQWPWSSESAHIFGHHDDTLVKAIQLLEITGGTWKDFLHAAIGEEGITKMQRHKKTGCPRGSGSFIENLESMPGRVLKPKKPGRKPKSELK